MNVADVRSINAQVQAKVRRWMVEMDEKFYQPDLEPQDLAEYVGLSEADKAAIYQRVGSAKFQEYTQAMEKLKARAGR